MGKIDYSRKDFYLIDKGMYKDYDYFILYNGRYIISYVLLKPEDKYYECYNYDDIDIDVHGGIIFSDKISEDYNKDYYLFRLGAKKGHWIGWDYAHSGDYSRDGFDYEKKWTLEEIISDCEKVIEQLIEFNNNTIKVISTKFEHYLSGLAIQINITSNDNSDAKWLLIREEDIEKVYGFDKQDLINMISEDIKKLYGFNKFNFITPYDENQYFEDVFNSYNSIIKLGRSNEE